MMTIQTIEIMSNSLAYSRFALYIQWLRFNVPSFWMKENDEAALRTNITLCVVFFFFFDIERGEISSYTKMKFLIYSYLGVD